MARVNGKNRRLKPTKFTLKWGISSQELAESEGVVPDTLHMRVRNYGTPFQRAKGPDRFERRYGKTQRELAELTGLSFNTIMFYENEKGGVFQDWKHNFNNRKSLYNPDTGWGSTKRRDQFWLHPEHPRYQDARDCKWFGDADE